MKPESLGKYTHVMEWARDKPWVVQWNLSKGHPKTRGKFTEKNATVPIDNYSGPICVFVHISALSLLAPQVTNHRAIISNRPQTDNIAVNVTPLPVCCRHIRNLCSTSQMLSLGHISLFCFASPLIIC